MNTVVADEYIAPDSSLAFMLNYWHGRKRLLWHWGDKNLGLHIGLPHRHIAPFVECGRWSWSFWAYRFAFCFSCEPIEESNARYREMFKDDIWPTRIYEDILDAEVIE